MNAVMARETHETPQDLLGPTHHASDRQAKPASILAGAAARAQRLSQLFRSTPDLPASTEFTEYEIEACYILTKANVTVTKHRVLATCCVDRGVWWLWQPVRRRKDARAEHVQL